MVLNTVPAKNGSRRCDVVSCEKGIGCMRVVHRGSVHAVAKLFARAFLAQDKRKLLIFLHMGQHISQAAKD